MRVPKHEPPALEDSPPKKSARPRRGAAMKDSPTEKIESGNKPAADVVTTEVEVDGNPTASSSYDGPFPSWRRPSPAECYAARDALALLHGEPGAIPVSPSSPPSSLLPSPSPSSQSPLMKKNNAKVFADPDGCHNDGCASVLDSLVRTILSQNTTDATSVRAFRSLKRALPTWEQARTAAPGVMEEAIRVGGLADIKAARIREILETLRAEALERRRRRGRGNGGGGGGGAEKEGKEKEKEKEIADDDKKKRKSKKAASGSETTTAADDLEFNNSLLSLEYLRDWADAEEVKGELVRFNGVGPKTAACVVLFALKREDFPVDTHIHRISASLGWTPKAATREQAYEHLRRKVPASVCHDLHVLLVAHGKVCRRCSASGGGGGEKCAMRLAVAEAVAAAGGAAAKEESR